MSPRDYRPNRDPNVRPLDRRTVVGASWSITSDGSVPPRPLVTGHPPEIAEAVDEARSGARAFSSRFHLAFYVEGRRVVRYRHRTRVRGWTGWSDDPRGLAILLRFGRTVQVELAPPGRPHLLLHGPRSEGRAP